MKKIYRVRLDNWHGYSGLWTLPEKACANLMKDRYFKRALNNPHGDHEKDSNGEKTTVYRTPDCAHNYKLMNRLSYNKDSGVIEIVAHGFKWTRTDETMIPEIKEPGKPYQPQRTDAKRLDPEFTDEILGRAEVIEIELDQVEDY